MPDLLHLPIHLPAFQGSVSLGLALRSRLPSAPFHAGIGAIIFQKIPLQPKKTPACLNSREFFNILLELVFMKKLKLFSAALCAFALSLFSCNYNLVPAPTSSGGTQKNPADYENTIIAPTAISASQGGYKSVTLNWTGLENATSYIVYSADTPFDTFVQIYQTVGKETSYIAEEEPGSSKYYCVSAVNYYGTISSKSKVVLGTTLAAPVITEVSPSPEGGSISVSWWMENCSSSTYEDKTSFILTAYDSEKNKISGSDLLISDGTCRQATVYGLSPKTDYYFQVEACIEGEEQVSEKSVLTSASTAHRTVPDAVENFTVSQGESIDDVKISWTLPSPVDYFNTANNIFTSNPVFFVIFRKAADTHNDQYEAIAKIGTCVSGDKAITFNCQNGGCSSANLSLEVNSDGICPENFAAYVSGSRLTYTDTSIPRGKKYSYYVQSFTDNSTKPTTSDSSISPTVDGWKIGGVSFNVNPTVETSSENENIITKISADSKLTFTSLGAEYTYVITRITSALEVESYGAEEFEFAANSISAINSYKILFDDPDSQPGYYKYKLYVCKHQDVPQTQVPSAEEILESAPAAQRITVTGDASIIPNIRNFKVQDGYKDKFRLTWDAIPNAIYTISYTPVVDGIEKEEQSLTLQNTSSSENGYYTVSGGTVTFDHAAEPGDCRKYSITANTGLSTTHSDDSVYQTLGSPRPVLLTPDYSTITVKWPAVQKADTAYSVSAKYAGTPTELSAENIEITEYDENTNEYTCVITKPEGYDNPKVSGKTIQLSVSARNTATGDVSSSSIDVCTLGPALIEASASEHPSSTNVLEVKWNAVEGAEKYLVYRVIYSDGNANVIEAADKCLVDGESLEVKDVSSKQDTANRTSVKKNGNKFILTDRQQDASDDTGGYQSNQEKIQWGLPFGYVILPIKKGGSDSDFNFESESFKLNSDSAVSYGTLVPVKTATYGYGLDIKASKSTSASSVLVEWNDPFYKGLTPTLYKRNLYKKDAQWEKVDTLGANINKYEVPVALADVGNAYEYAIQYEAGSTCSFVKSFTDKLKSTKETRYTYPDGVEAEQANKGYALALENFTAEYGGQGTAPGNSAYFQENVSWTPWNYEVRALGPDSFTVDLKNLNLGNEWNSLANVAIDEDTQNISIITNLSDTSVERTASGISAKPTGLSNGSKTNTDGLLKVLRDAKHYYSIELTAKHTGSEKTTRQAANQEVFAYRQISDEELVKMVNLIIADALYQTGIPTNGTTAVWDRNPATKELNSNGTFSISHIPWDDYVYYSFTNYKHVFKAGFCSSYLVETESDFTISSNESAKKKGLKANTVYYLPQVTISTSHASGLSSYEAQLNFTAGAEGTKQVWNLTVSKAGVSSPVVNISGNKDNFLSWFPYDIGAKHINGDATVNSALCTYTSGWWY